MASTGTGVDAGLDRALALGEQGIQVAAYVGDELVIDAWAGVADEATGRAVDGDTLFPVFSVTKAITVTALHIQVDRGLLSYSDRVADHWPEYGVNGKGSTTIRDALTHRSGAPQMPPGVTPELMCDWEWMVKGIAAQEPAFPPGTQSAYHSIVYGWLIGEIVRRTDPAGRGLGEFIRAEICEPLGIDDLYLGVPDEALDRVAVLTSNIPDVPETEPLPLSTKPTSVPFGPELYNRRDVAQACLGGAGGIMSARAQSRVFAMLANRGELDGVRLLSEDLLMSLTERRENPDQIDAVMAGGGKIPIDLTVGGYWNSDLIAGTGRHFLCHAGYGSSVGWADLDANVAVSICHNRLFQLPQLDEHHPYGVLRANIDEVTSRSRAS
jgi:CubicO group peptidase (beta-lactamase class C family)